MQNFNRSAVAALSIAVMGLALLGVFVWRQVTGPSDGTRLEPGEQVWTTDGVIVTALEDRPGGLRTGDVVVAVDGVTMETWARALLCPKSGCGAPQRLRWRVGQTVTYTVERQGRQTDLQIVLGKYPLRSVLGRSWTTLVYAVMSLAIVTFVIARRPSEPAPRPLLVSAAGMLASMPWTFGLQVGHLVEGVDFWLHRIATDGVYLLTWTGLFHFALIFPKPHPLVQRRRWIVPAAYLFAFVAYGVFVLAARSGTVSTLDWLSRLAQGNTAIVFLYLLLTLLAFVMNYRAQRDATSRQQMRIIAFANILVIIFAVSLWLLPQLILDGAVFSAHIMALIGLILPLAMAVSILRYRLWDIDIILNRTLVYLVLTLAVIGLYVAIVGGIGTLFQTQDTLGISLLATGVVAVAFQPLRQRLQRAVNRLMYGERDEPYAVLSRLGRRLEATLAPQAVLPTIVETVAQALKLPYVAIALKEEDDFRVTASTGKPVEAPSVLPLTYQAEVVGQLICAPRAPGEPFNAAEQRLLEDVAHQAGVAVHAVRLTADLQRSRQRLVAAREEERRRLRRDLHDGLGPTLAALHLQAGGLRRVIRSNPGTAEGMAEEFRLEIRAVIDDIRRLVYELRPPTLDELGLLGAIQAHADKCSLKLASNSGGNRQRGMQVIVDAPEDFPLLPAAVEVAAYRIAQEALTNVVRHAQASHCMVRLHLRDGLLNIEVTDDGVGFPKERVAGVGLRSMHERAAELGGMCLVESAPQAGTRVRIHLPLPEE